MRVGVVGMWLLFVVMVCITRVNCINVLSQYTQISLDPITGEETESHFFFMRCTQSDNAGTFIAFNIAWTNQTATNETVIKITCAPPRVQFVVSQTLLMTPFQCGIVKGTICSATNVSIGFIPTQLPVPPGTPPDATAYHGEPLHRGRHTLMHHDPETMRLQQRGMVDQRFERHPTEITHGPARFVPQIGPIATAFGVGLLGGIIGGKLSSYLNPKCWLGGCSSNSNALTALTQRLDDMIQSLANYAAIQTQLAQNQQNLNEQFAKSLVTQSIINDDILRAQRQQQAEIDVIKEQVNMLKAAITVISQQQVEQGILFTAITESLQEQINDLAKALGEITDVTQAQIFQHTGWIRTLVRIGRMTQASLLNLVTQSDFKTGIIATFFEIQSLTNATFLQPFLTSSEFQPPNQDLVFEYTTIDTMYIQYTYQEDEQSTVLGVNSVWSYSCKNAFILQFPRLGVSYIDLLEYFGPDECVASIGNNNTCQCYWTISAFTAPLFFDTAQHLYRPYPFGFPGNPTLDCDPFTGTLAACASNTITAFSDPYNEHKTSQAGIAYSVGTYSVMEGLNDTLDEDMDTSLENPPTSIFGVLRKMCNQQVGGKILPLLGSNPGAFTVPECAVGNTFQPCFNPPGGGAPRFTYGPDQTNPDLKYNTMTPPANYSIRLISTILNSMWSMKSTTTSDQCPLGTINMGFSINIDTNTIGLYQVFFYALQNGDNAWIEALYTSLETNVTGIMPPDVQWTSELFPPSGQVNGAGCETFTLVMASSPEFWETVQTLEQQDTITEVNVTYFSQDEKTMLTGPIIQTSVSPLLSYPLPSIIRLAGPTTFNQPGAYTYDVSLTDISTSSPASARGGTVTYLALPPSVYADALFRNIPFQALWQVVYGDIFDPVAGNNALSNYLQFMTEWAPGRPSQCIQTFRLTGGWCNVLDNFEYILISNRTAVFIPYVQWSLDFQVTLPSAEIFRRTTSVCLFDSAIPLYKITTAGSGASQTGIFEALNPSQFDNYLLYNVKSTADNNCGARSNVGITIPAFGSTSIFFPACNLGTRLTISFAIPNGAFSTPCPGSITFQQGFGQVFNPGSQPPNVQSYEKEVTNNIVQQISNTNAELTGIIVEIGTSLVQGPSQAVFDTIYRLSNMTLDSIFDQAANLTGCDARTGKGCGITNIFDGWDELDKEFERAREAATNATDNAEKNNEKLKQDNEAITELNEWGKNLTDQLTQANDDLQNKIIQLHNAIENFIKSQGGGGGLSTWIIVVIVIILVIAIALAIWYFCFKKKDQGAELPKPKPKPAPAASSGGGSSRLSKVDSVVNVLPPNQYTMAYKGAKSLGVLGAIGSTRPTRSYAVPDLDETDEGQSFLNN